MPLYFLIAIVVGNAHFATGPFQSREACESARQMVLQIIGARGYAGIEARVICVPDRLP